MAISMKELNPHNYPVSELVESNLEDHLRRMNLVRTAYNHPMTVNSGLRSDADQARINPDAPKSNHLVGNACDIADPDGKVREWVLANLPLMKSIGLWFEDFRWTPGWVHFQRVPPTSGHRIYVPSSKPALSPDCWDGNYDHSMDGF